jgi:phosphoadenosine phosphosulfate reductase
VLAYALGHGDVVDVLEEAHRLLKPGGSVLLHDVFAPTHEEATAFRTALNYEAHNPDLLDLWFRLIGFDFVGVTTDEFLAPGNTVASVAPLVTRMQHGVAIYTKSDRAHRFAGRKVALQLSGGKDSVACLYMLRPFLRKYITTYWLNTGDVIPETLAVLDELRTWVPNFVEICSDVKQWRIDNGMPSDLVPARSHAIGLMYGMSTTRISNRFDCCAANLMLPMHARAKQDGIDLIIRGTKLHDTGKVPFEGWHDGLEVWLPLRDMTHDDVFRMLGVVGAPVSAVYKFATGISAPECLGCTAWWDDKKAAYLKAWHPVRFVEYKRNLSHIANVVASHMADLYAELSEE